jgi:hypothetical protein
MEDHKIKKPNLNLASISLAHANCVAGDYSAQNTGDDRNNIDETRSAHMCQGNREIPGEDIEILKYSRVQKEQL